MKNPHRDIYIDERGNYCRVGNTMNLDCNIGEKMNDKVYLLREALKSSGYSNANIISLVVFTNSTMHVDNRYDYITTCFLGNLPHIIERYDGKPIYNDSCISAMMESVTNVEAVKGNGFNDVGFENSNSYRATNADGVEAHITYTAVEEKMTGCVERE